MACVSSYEYSSVTMSILHCLGDIQYRALEKYGLEVIKNVNT